MEFFANLIEIWCITSGIGTVAFLFLLVYDFLKGFFEVIIRDYKIKHRFDKPPVAKCYCKDCIHLGEYTHECDIIKHYEVRENNFCNYAKPRKKVE